MMSTPQRVADLFASLAGLDPAEAERRLTAECRGDERLADRVRALLAHDREAAGDFLVPISAKMVPAPAGREPAGSERASFVPLSSRLGRYHVLHQVGEGGMASVYVGYDEALDRRVALKVVRGDAATRDWLLREGQALGRLTHPNVVSIYEVGEYEGVVFLAMELVEGVTLRQWLDEQPRTFTDILRLFLQAGRGLAAAHRAGLVHRDFKPENVLVGKDGRARVADFGLSALASRASVDATLALDALPASLLERPLTQHGAFYGTPAYMAPEQFDGARASIASDQWSFAAALYAAAYGTPPYPHEGSLLLLANRVRAEPPAEPPRRSDVPAWLWPILTRSLARRPEERFPSMDAVLDAIQRHVPRDPDLDPTITARERRVLTALIVGNYLVHSTLMLIPATARILVRPAGLLAVGVASCIVVPAIVIGQWRKLAQNAYGRRIAALFLGFAFGLLAHRALGLRLGLSGPQVLVEDAVLFAVGFAMTAHGEHRWFGWLAASYALAAALGTVFLSQVTTIVGVVGLMTALGFSLRTFADRHLRREAAVGGIEREELEG